MGASERIAERALGALRREPGSREAWEATAVELCRGAPVPEWLRGSSWRARLVARLRSSPSSPGLVALLLLLLDLEPLSVAKPGTGPPELPTRVRCRRSLVELGWLPGSGALAAPDGRSPWVPAPGVWLGRCAVEVASYARYLEETGRAPPPGWEQQRRHPGRPVVQVTWEQARAFCRWAGGRLPLASEWRAAALGAPLLAPVAAPGVGWPAYAGATMLERHLEDDPEELLARRYGTLPEADAGEPGPLGHHGLAGLVREWCEDWCPDGTRVRGPREITDSRRVRVGVSWLDPERGRDPARVEGATAADWWDLETGFRLARPLLEATGGEPAEGPGDPTPGR